MKAIVTFLLPLLLAACAGQRQSMHEAAPVHHPVVYSCDDGLTLRVRFARDGAHVTLPSGEQVLRPQQLAASGISYGTDRDQLRGKGDDAPWTSGQRKPVGCRVQR